MSLAEVAKKYHVSRTKRSARMNEWMRQAMARDILTRLTVDMLLRHFPHEETRRYDGQILEAREFVKSVADHLCVMPRGTFPEKAIQDALLSVSAAYDELRAEEPVEFQRALPWRSWQHEGVRIN
jgi:hypothetical protein